MTQGIISQPMTKRLDEAARIAKRYVDKLYGGKTLLPTYAPLTVLAPSTSGKTTMLSEKTLGGWNQSRLFETVDGIVTAEYTTDGDRSISFTDIDTFMNHIIRECSSDDEISAELRDFAKTYTLDEFYSKSNEVFGRLQWDLVYDRVELDTSLLLIIASAVSLMLTRTCFLMATRENMNMITLHGNVVSSGLIVTPLEAKVMQERSINRDGKDLGIQHYMEYAGTIANYYFAADMVIPMTEEVYLSQVISPILAGLINGKASINEDEEESQVED